MWRGPEHNELIRLQMAPVMGSLPGRIREKLPKPGWLDISTPEGLTAEVCAAGFVDPEITVAQAVLTTPTPRAMWGMMQENPLTRPLLAMLAKDELAVIERSVLSTFEGMAGGADRPVRFEASAHLLIARRG